MIYIEEEILHWQIGIRSLALTNFISEDKAATKQALTLLRKSNIISRLNISRLKGIQTDKESL